MRYVRYAFLALLGVSLITVALANRAAVTLRLLPEDLAGFLGWQTTISLPLFVVIFGGIVAGLLIGFVWEWFREHKHRAEVSRQKRQVVKLKGEVDRLKTDAPQETDDVLALLETGGATR